MKLTGINKPQAPIAKKREAREIPEPNTEQVSRPRSSEPDRFLRLPEVQRLVPLSRSSIWRNIRDGKFPRSVRISANANAWRLRDIDEWMNQR